MTLISLQARPPIQAAPTVGKSWSSLTQARTSPRPVTSVFQPWLTTAISVTLPTLSLPPMPPTAKHPPHRAIPQPTELPSQQPTVQVPFLIKKSWPQTLTPPFPPTGWAILRISFSPIKAPRSKLSGTAVASPLLLVISWPILAAKLQIVFRSLVIRLEHSIFY